MFGEEVLVFGRPSLNNEPLTSKVIYKTIFRRTEYLVNSVALLVVVHYRISWTVAGGVSSRSCFFRVFTTLRTSKICTIGDITYECGAFVE